MRIQLLIADCDRDYAEQLSKVLAEKYADIFEVSACFSEDQLLEMTSHHKYDAALLNLDLAANVDLGGIRLPLALWDGSASSWPEGMDGLRKYQRISSIASEVLERCAKISSIGLAPNRAKGHITIVWSPAGGVGKTTVAMAYAAQKVSNGERTTYLDLEPFSSSPVFFAEGGKSISTVFGKLEEQPELILQGIRQEDSGSGISYFCRPDNYEDIALLTGEDVMRLTDAAAAGMDELVVDVGDVYDSKTAALFDIADTVLLVVDESGLCQTKWEQFQSQNGLQESLWEKSIFVVNRGGRYNASRIQSQVILPLVRSEDPIVVYKTLSAGYFQV